MLPETSTENYSDLTGKNPVSRTAENALLLGKAVAKQVELVMRQVARRAEAESWCLGREEFWRTQLTVLRDPQ